MKFFTIWRKSAPNLDSVWRGFNPRRDWQILLLVWFLVLAAVITSRTLALLAWQSQFETVIDETRTSKTINEERLGAMVAAIRARAARLAELKQHPLKVTDPS